MVQDDSLGKLCWGEQEPHFKLSADARTARVVRKNPPADVVSQGRVVLKERTVNELAV